MEIAEVGISALFLAFCKHTKNHTCKSTGNLSTHQGTVHGTQVIEFLSIKRIGKTVHLAIAADTQFHSVFAQTGNALHNIVDAFQFAAQSHLFLGNGCRNER